LRSIIIIIINFDQKYETEKYKLICVHTHKHNTKYLTGITNIAAS